MKKVTEKKQAKTSKKVLTPRRKKLVDEMANPKNKSVAEAARKAGYSPSSARSTVYGVVPVLSEAVQNRIDRALKHHRVTPEEVLGSAVFQMRSSMNDVLNDKGYFDLEKARETGAVDLLKKHKQTDRNIKDSKGQVIETVTTIEVEMLTNQDGRKEVANYIGLEKSPVMPSTSGFTDEELARELYRRLIEKRGWTPKKALQGIKQRFPEIDPELLNA